MAKAISHPQSKKCLISPSQTMNMMTAPSKPGMNEPMIALRMVPRRTIQIASRNFALSFPTRDLPDIQRNGATIIVPTMILIRMLTMSICLNLLLL